MRPADSCSAGPKLVRTPGAKWAIIPPSDHSSAAQSVSRCALGDNALVPYRAVSERGSPFTTAGFARTVERAAEAAGLELKAHPHTLRQACGYALADEGHDTRAIQAWLGHRSITSTAVYTALATRRTPCGPLGASGSWPASRDCCLHCADGTHDLCATTRRGDVQRRKAG
jgi:hypothetical protein